jgi:hypothetical protein
MTTEEGIDINGTKFLHYAYYKKSYVYLIYENEIEPDH